MFYYLIFIFIIYPAFAQYFKTLFSPGLTIIPPPLPPRRICNHDNLFWPESEDGLLHYPDLHSLQYDCGFVLGVLLDQQGCCTSSHISGFDIIIQNISPSSYINILLSLKHKVTLFYNKDLSCAFIFFSVHITELNQQGSIEKI